MAGLRPDPRRVIDLRREDWMDSANCRGMDPNLFFGGRGDPDAHWSAVRTCQACEVRIECLDYALRNGERHGVWGGLSEKQRRMVRRKRALARRMEWKEPA